MRNCHATTACGGIVRQNAETDLRPDPTAEKAQNFFDQKEGDAHALAKTQGEPEAVALSRGNTQPFAEGEFFLEEAREVESDPERNAGAFRFSETEKIAVALTQGQKIQGLTLSGRKRHAISFTQTQEVEVLAITLSRRGQPADSLAERDSFAFRESAREPQSKRLAITEAIERRHDFGERHHRHRQLSARSAEDHRFRHQPHDP